jgi:hypothetical protein
MPKNVYGFYEKTDFSLAENHTEKGGSIPRKSHKNFTKKISFFGVKSMTKKGEKYD